MRIGFVAGAHSIHTQRWVRYFAARGHAVHLVSLGCDSDAIDPRIQLHVVRKDFPRAVRPFVYWLRTRRALRAINPDVVHAHQVWLDGIIAAFSTDAPLVITPWGSDVLLLPPRGIRRQLSRMALRRASLVTCDGLNTRQALVRLGVAPDLISIVRFGVEVDRFVPRSPDPRLTATYGFQDNPVILSTRSLKPIYDVKTLINSVPLVCRSIPAVRFLIVGEGPERPALEEQCRSLAILPSVIFAGSMPAEDIPLLMNLADVYVSTSLSDSGLAAGTAEAMASGLPVVVTDSGDNREWIREEENGYVVPSGRPEALAAKILQLLQKPDEARLIGCRNRDKILEQNNYQREMEKMEGLYQRLVAVRRRP